MLTTISDSRRRGSRAPCSPAGRAKLVRLPPPVDLDRFRRRRCRRSNQRTGTTRGRGRPDGAAEGLRHAARAGRYCWPAGVRDARPAELVLVGDGPQRARLEGAGPAGSGCRRRAAHPAPLAAGRRSWPSCRRPDVFALPVRTPAAAGWIPRASGSPRSRRPPAACPWWSVAPAARRRPWCDGRTGFVVDPDDPSSSRPAADLLARARAWRGDWARRAGRRRRRFGADAGPAALRSVLPWGCAGASLPWACGRDQRIVACRADAAHRGRGRTAAAWPTRPAPSISRHRPRR